MAIQAVTASFDGSQDTVTVTFSGIVTNPPTVTQGICVNDGQTVSADITSLTNAGCTVAPTARFNGTVELIVEG